jgi:hypothetical protein
MPPAGPGAGFPRSLLAPFTPASLLFILPSAVLLNFLQGGGVAGLFGIYLLLAWLLKYGYVLLKHVANGEREAPTVSVEMLSPFEQRPLLQAVVCVGIYWVMRAFGLANTAVLAVLILAVMPASMAVLGLGYGVLQAVNPLLLFRVARALGVYYLAVLGLIGGGLLLIFGMSRLGAWNVLTIAAAELIVLLIFSALGGALFERRTPLGYQPRSSPERRLESEARDHRRELDSQLDRMYVAMRMGRYDEVIALARQAISQSSDPCLRADVLELLRRIRQWGSPRVVSSVSEVLAADLKSRKKDDLAREITRL